MGMETKSGWKYSENQYLTSLGFSKLKKLSDILDTKNHTSKWPWWKELAGKVPGVKYLPRDIERMGGNTSDGNAAYAFLVDLSNRSIRLGQLIAGLKAIEMNEALKELSYQGMYVNHSENETVIITVVVSIYTEDVKFVEQPQSTVSAEGGTVTLKCKATGFPPPSYQWFKDRTELSGETSPHFTIDNVKLDQVSCIVMMVGLVLRVQTVIFLGLEG